MPGLTALRTPRRGWVVLLALLGALALLGTASTTWVTADLGAALVADRTVDVSGATAAPVVPAVALVALAAAGATSIARRAGRVVAGLLLVAAGVAGLVGAVGVLLDPDAAVGSSVGDVTGGTAAATAAVVTAWPWLSCLPSLLVATAGLLVLLARWETGRRFEPVEPDVRSSPPAGPDPAAARDPDPADDWDALSRGDDPTSR